jgi:hypothetical protein
LQLKEIIRHPKIDSYTKAEGFSSSESLEICLVDAIDMRECDSVSVCRFSWSLLLLLLVLPFFAQPPNEISQSAQFASARGAGKEGISTR